MAEAMGFFTDTTVCIGCKACEVACKEWNQLPAENGGIRELSGDSYDNTRRLDGIHWRHVRFIEQFKGPYDGRWLMMSDVCKHCVQAGCLEVCPTGAIIRTEFDTVVIQSDVCNGCRACIAACPFGVIDVNPVSGTAQKCTLCYDRLKVGLEPACSKACPTDSIQFGTIAELRPRAQKRVDQLKAQGVEAHLYGADPTGPLGGLNSFYLLVDKDEVYGLPHKPQLPSRNLTKSAGFSVASRAATTLPVRIWRSIQADLIGVALHIENAGLGLVHALAGVFHDGAPLVGAIHGIDGKFAEVAFGNQVLQILGGLLLVVGVVVDDGAQCKQVVFENAFFGPDNGPVVNRYGHGDQDHHNRDHHHQFDESEAAQAP